MIDPQKILTENKERDAQILEQYWVEKKSQTDIATSFKISQSRVAQILYANRSLIKYDPDYEKAKRIRHYEQQYENAQPEAHSQEHWLDKIRDEVDVVKVEESTPDWLKSRLTTSTN